MGAITRMDNMEELWRFTFSHELRVDPNESPVLLTEPERLNDINVSHINIMRKEKKGERRRRRM